MKILLAVDGSEYSEEAARALTCMDLTEQDEIMLVHVVSWVPFQYDAASYYENLKQIKQDVAPRIIDSALRLLTPVKARISTAIIDGSPDRYIAETAAEAGMDLIVMGARGVKGMKSVLIGSVTKAVALHASKPVLVIKPGFCGRAAGGKMRVILAVDGSESSEQAAMMLAAMPLGNAVEITIFNAIWSDFSDIPERFVAEINDRVKDVIAENRTQEFKDSEQVLEKAQQFLRDRFSSISLVSRVGDPSQEIMKIAEVRDASMIVAGCRGLRGIPGMMGSVSRNILTHAGCSVLIGRTCTG
ncbi:MAG: universal stress protein [Nitrospirae bacterium]|nr:MAG: universal stress protein [Nitrospirota bacterium]